MQQAYRAVVSLNEIKNVNLLITPYKANVLFNRRKSKVNALNQPSINMILYLPWPLYIGL